MSPGKEWYLRELRPFIMANMQFEKPSWNRAVRLEDERLRCEEEYERRLKVALIWIRILCCLSVLAFAAYLFWPA